MTREELERLKVIKCYMECNNAIEEEKFFQEDIDILQKAITELEQEPCDDCISRKELLKCSMRINDNFVAVSVKDIREAPSVQPERPHGEWIKMRNGQLECNKCYTRQNKALNYCPYCGAEMVQGNDTKITKELSNKQ